MCGFLRAIQTLTILAHVVSVGTSEPTEFVRVGMEDIPVRMEPETLIVGIDPDKLVRRYLPDFDLFEMSIMMPAPDGLTYTWYPVRPSPGNDNSKGSVWPTQPDRRFVRLEFGVFPSHRAALIGANWYFSDIQAVPQLLPLSSDDPRWVAWTMSGSGAGIPNMFVRDNVFVNVQVAEELDPPAFVKRLDEDLKRGAEGVFKGEKVNPPVIIDRGFPSSFSLRAGEKGLASLEAHDPEGRSIYPKMRIANFEAVFRELNTEYSDVSAPLPDVKWKQPGEVEINPEGRSVTLELNAVVVNDLCVVSDVWSKTVQISVGE